MDTAERAALAKVPQVTLGFWLIKIAATTLGETAGDAVSMSMELGYLVGSALFALVFAAAVGAQIAARRFNPPLYWATIIATTTVGTTLADFVDRSLGVGYAGGSSILLGLLLASLLAWRRVLGSIAVETVADTRSEVFYWLTILFSQTLGTALGDWVADSAGIGYGGAALVFGALFVVIERRSANAFFDFRLFGNPTYTGATISNFLINATAGTLIVSLQLAQLGAGMNAQQAGLLTLCYVFAIIVVILAV